MRILVTGAGGFVGKNLCAQLNNIKSGKAKRYGGITVSEVYEYDMKSSAEDLERYCRDCDFVFNLAGVNRPEHEDEFMKGNFGFASLLLETLKKHGNTCPVMISSSIQAGLSGRFGESEYGRSKRAGERLMFEYGRETGAKVLVYRFPNLFGKWCRPNYNSAIATFCYNVAYGLPLQINDRNTELELLYIDDLVDEMVGALKGNEHHCEYDGMGESAGRYCCCPVTHKATLGEIADMLYSFAGSEETLMIPEMPADSLVKKLFSTYLSYLPEEKIAFPLKMHEDERGSFTELVRTLNCGQVSINVSRPGVTKGRHWHNTKWEFFTVVSGRALIRQRCVYSDRTISVEVSGDRTKAVRMLPGYTHEIVNLSDTENLVTVMYCNELFNPDRPDTYFLPVEQSENL